MIVALVTDAQTVGKILIACATPVLAAVWFGRRRPVDLYRDLACEDRARAHGRMVRARRLARRQRHCGHPVDERFDVFEPGGVSCTALAAGAGSPSATFIHCPSP